MHLYGQPADMDPIVEIARRHGLTSSRTPARRTAPSTRAAASAASATSAASASIPARTSAPAAKAAWSSPTNDAYVDERMRMLRDWGCRAAYHHVLQGFNYRMEGIQGAILGVKLRHLDAWTEARRDRAPRLRPAPRRQRRRDADADAVRKPRLSHLRGALRAIATRWRRRSQSQGIQTGHPLSDPGAPAGGPSRSRLQARGSSRTPKRPPREVLSLPLYPELPMAQLETVAQAVHAAQPVLS